MRAGVEIPRAGALLAGLALSALLIPACASRARSFGPPTAEQSATALERWGSALARAGVTEDANVLYDASLSQGLLKTHGTLAVRLRGTEAEGTLAGSFGSPIATYENGELRGEKLRPVVLPAPQLRALLAGVWTGAPPAVAGQSGEFVLLRWSGEDAAEGVLALPSGELESLRIDRPEAQLEVRFSGPRNPWPDQIEIREKRTGSSLRLRMISREAPP